MARRRKGSFFKTIGVLTFFGAIGLGLAVYTGAIDLHTNVKITSKGERQVKELRNKTADLIRNAGK
jgi:hypothetical protein